MCMNRVMFKQLMQANAIEFCQIDSARLGGVNEILAVYFMAKKFNGSSARDKWLWISLCIKFFFSFFFLWKNAVKVCPHAGGVGLCEMVQHLQMWDYTSVACTKTDRYVEYVDQQHEQFVHPTVVKNAHYAAPLVSIIEIKISTKIDSRIQFPFFVCRRPATVRSWRKMPSNNTNIQTEANGNVCSTMAFSRKSNTKKNDDTDGDWWGGTVMMRINWRSELESPCPCAILWHSIFVMRICVHSSRALQIRHRRRNIS